MGISSFYRASINWYLDPMRVLIPILAFVCLLLAAGDTFKGNWSSGQNDAAGTINIQIGEPAAVQFTLQDREVKTKVLSLKREGAGVEIRYEFELDGTRLISTLTGEILGSRFAGRYQTTAAGGEGIVDSGKFNATRE
jgi:hypothetical protein